jgi:hypothetical protein
MNPRHGSSGIVLLWGLAEDSPLDAVRLALESHGAPVAFLDQRAGAETVLDLTVGDTVTGTLRVGDETIALESIAGIYLRPYDARQLPDVREAGPTNALWLHHLGLQHTLQAWADLTPARVVNRPADMAANTSKPYQAAQIQRAGFVTPPTLLTTDAAAVAAFAAEHGTLIYKSLSGTRSMVSRLEAEQWQRIETVAWCPTQFQAFIPGVDYRIHVVGHEIFACKVISAASDYRYPEREGVTISMTPFVLPEVLANQCRELADQLRLHVAGIDLRQTPDGDWYCFEVNPSPAFTAYQAATHQPIAEAIAQLLMATA